MPRRPTIPPELTTGPFTLSDAVRSGLTRHQLESSCWRRIGPQVYIWTGRGNHPRDQLAAAVLRLPPGSALGGKTAAWLHGLDFQPLDPIEASVPRQSGIAGRLTVRLRRVTLHPDDVVNVDGLPVTSPAQTLADLAPRLPLIDGVVAADRLLHLRRVTVEELEQWAARHRRRRGVRAFRQLLKQVEPASESQMESRLRMLLVLAGLPRPQAQADLHDHRGNVIARADLFYPQAHLAIEYDGATHRESLLEDNRRQNQVLGAGYRLLRFAAGDVLRAPDSVVGEVRQALLRAAA